MGKVKNIISAKVAASQDIVFIITNKMNLFVGNISKNVSISKLEDEFEKFGRCEITPRGSYAFIVFDDDKSAEEAMEQLQGLTLGGLSIGIEWSKRSDRY